MQGGGLTLDDLGGGDMLRDLVATLAEEGGGVVLQFNFFFTFL